VDHSILLTVLKDRFVIKEGVLDWFRSYLTGRTQCISASTGWSEPTKLTCGVPQGSVLGPAKFIAYTEDLHNTIYCNSALVGLSDSTLAPLQRVLHAAARFVLDLQPQDHVTVALQTLH